jgi:hypothetical protein
MGSLDDRDKDGQVMALGDLDDKRFRCALYVEISREFKTKESSLTTYDAVFAGVEPRRFLKHLDANLLLGGVFWGLSDGTRSDMK